MELKVAAECALAGAPPPVAAEIRRVLAVDNPKYRDAVRFGRWIGKNLEPRLRFYREEDGVLVFPRGFANQAVRICRRLGGGDPRIIDQRLRLEPLELAFSGTLRPYQAEAVEAVCARSFGVLEAATGSGKTVMALAAAARRAQPCLVLVHSRELLHQWAGRIEEFLGIRPGLAGDGRFEPGPVTVGIVNTVRRRLDQLVPRVGHLVVDECHRVPASLFTEVVNAFPAWYMLGLSATAFRREDGLTPLINWYMGDTAHRVDPGTLAAAGAIVRPRLAVHPTGFSCPYGGNYQDLLARLTADPRRNRLIVDQVAADAAAGRCVLLVSDRVDHCQALATALEEAGVNAALLTGRTPARQRRDIVRALGRGEIQALVSTLQLIGEGFDCPGLDTLHLATPIRFEGRLLQVAGRIMRPAAGKEAVIHDYVDERIPSLRRMAEHRARVLAGQGRDQDTGSATVPGFRRTPGG